PDYPRFCCFKHCKAKFTCPVRAPRRRPCMHAAIVIETNYAGLTGSLANHNVERSWDAPRTLLEAALLRVSNVRKVFESTRGTYIALDGVSLTISDGE